MPDQIANGLDNLKKLTTDIATREGFKDYEIVHESLSTDGANYMGAIYNIDIKERDRELNLFGKVSNTPEKARDLVNANEIYKREVFVYETLASVFTDLETRHGVPEEHRYQIVKYYGSDLTVLEETVVLENIAKKGYVVYDRFKSVDWEYATAALDELAKFHALSYALEREDPEKFEELIKRKKYLLMPDEKPGSRQNEYFEGVLKPVLAAIDKEHVPAFITFFKELGAFYSKQFLSDEYSVLAHADYRPSNILVKYEEGRIKSMIPVDYQTIFYGSPINDLLYFLFLGSDQQFRREHYQACIHHYYRSLGECLARLSLDIDEVYPREVFDRHLEEKLPFGLAVSVFILPIVLVTSADAPKVENIVEFGIKSSDLYNQRLREIVQDFVEWGVLKV